MSKTLATNSLSPGARVSAHSFIIAGARPQFSSPNVGEVPSPPVRGRRTGSARRRGTWRAARGLPPPVCSASLRKPPPPRWGRKTEFAIKRADCVSQVQEKLCAHISQRGGGGAKSGAGKSTVCGMGIRPCGGIRVSSMRALRKCVGHHRVLCQRFGSRFYVRPAGQIQTRATPINLNPFG